MRAWAWTPLSSRGLPRASLAITGTASSLQGADGSHNCNADKNKYKRLGIRMITHDERQKRDVLLEDVWDQDFRD